MISQSNQDGSRPKVITCEEMCDMRLQGMSFEDIAQRLNMSKPSTYATFTYYRENNFNGYEPLPLRNLSRQLKTNRTMAQIAKKHKLSAQGVKNYCEDHGIMRKMSAEKITELYITEKYSLGYISDYYGISRFTLRTFMRENNIQKGVKEN